MSPCEFGSNGAEHERPHLLERAEFHLGLGEKAADTGASWTSFQLASRYLDRADGGAADAAPGPAGLDPVRPARRATSRRQRRR